LPDMRELMDTMNRLSLLTAEFEGKVKVTEWYVVIYTPRLEKNISNITD